MVPFKKEFISFLEERIETDFGIKSHLQEMDLGSQNMNIFSTPIELSLISTEQFKRVLRNTEEILKNTPTTENVDAFKAPYWMGYLWFLVMWHSSKLINVVNEQHFIPLSYIKNFTQVHTRRAALIVLFDLDTDGVPRFYLTTDKIFCFKRRSWGEKVVGHTSIRTESFVSYFDDKYALFEKRLPNSFSWFDVFIIINLIILTSARKNIDESNLIASVLERLPPEHLKAVEIKDELGRDLTPSGEKVEVTRIWSPDTINNEDMLSWMFKQFNRLVFYKCDSRSCSEARLWFSGNVELNAKMITFRINPHEEILMYAPNDSRIRGAASQYKYPIVMDLEVALQLIKDYNTEGVEVIKSIDSSRKKSILQFRNHAQRDLVSTIFETFDL